LGGREELIKSDSTKPEFIEEKRKERTFSEEVSLCCRAV